MEALSAYMRERHGFMTAKMKAGQPNGAQLKAFLVSLCAGCRPLVQAEGVAESVAPDLRSGFASIGWDVKTNGPAPGSGPPSPEQVLGFLDKAATKFAPRKPKKLQLEVSAAAEPSGNDDSTGLQFGAPNPVAAPATQEARDAQDARAAKLTPHEHPKGTRNAQFKLRVSDVPPSTSPAALKATFDAFGALEAEVAGAMAFVSFSSQEQLDNALKTGASIETQGGTKKLSLSIARDRGNRTPSSARSNPDSARSNPGSARGGTPGSRGTPGGRTTPGGSGGPRDRGRGDSSDWRRGNGPPAQTREDPRSVPLLARAQSEGVPTTKWDAPPPDKWNAGQGWTEVATKSAKGSKTPTGRGGGAGGKGVKTRSAPNTPRGGKGGKGGRTPKGGGKGEHKNRQGQWAAQQQETPEVESDDEEVPEPVFEPNTWQLTLQGFWQTSGELGQVVGMGYHRHWTGKVNFTADGKFWMIKTDQKPNAKRKQLLHWSADSGTSGRWERQGPKLLLYWFKWPAEKLKTKDGGQTFHSTQGYKFSIEYEQTLKEWHPAHMPKDFVPAGSTPKGRKKFIMPTREERTLNLLKKYKAMGENLEAPYPEGTEPTEIVTFLISSLFDMYQIMSLTLTFRISKGGARGTAICSELLQFSDATLEQLKKFNLGKFLERNDEKRISALQDLADRVWAVVKEPLYACPVPDVAAAEAELERIASLEPVATESQRNDEKAEAEPESSQSPPVDRATLERKLNGTWAEFMMLKDVTEAVECTKEFAHPTHNDLVCKVLIIEKLLEAKASAVDEQIGLLAKLFNALRKASPPVISATEFEAGLLRTCNAVADASLDAPSCPTLVAKLFVQMVAMECMQVGMLQTILVEQDLVEFGTASKMVVAVLTALKQTEGVGEEGLKQMLTSTPLDFNRFNPEPPRAQMDELLGDAGLQSLL